MSVSFFCETTFYSSGTCASYSTTVSKCYITEDLVFLFFSFLRNFMVLVRLA
ncbi:hypothetical protein BDA96_09G191300 [Sorghum bicolor]|uniref:Uncharacterized protein n=1 Tax=Sorghum bicolor TaxID=4558 RepID=A0A921QD94_SORBI|nr:hypothetical protein BDA96_09G191300 [Sorghum bicolor]